MRETSGHPKLPPIIFIELNSYMPRECRTAYSNIDRDIENAPAQDRHKLTLSPWILNMESAYYAVRRTRKVILHERPSDTRLCVTLGLERFEEEASRISEHLWLDDHDVGNFRSNDLHGKPRIDQTLPNLFISPALTVAYTKSIK